MRARALVLVVVLACCGGDGEDAAEPTARSTEAAVTPDEAVELIRWLAEPRSLNEQIPRLSSDFRRWSGTKYNRKLLRRAGVDALRASAEDPDKKFPLYAKTQILITDGPRALRVVIDKRLARGPPRPGVTTGGMLRADQLRLVREEGVVKLAEHIRYDDRLTEYRQAEFKNLPPGPMAEKPWPGAPVVVVAADGEKEAARVAMVTDWLDGFAAGDASRVADKVGPGFVDRDVTETEPIVYDQPAQFAQRVKEELDRYDRSIFDTLEVWGAGDWVVARVRHALLLEKGLPGYPETAGQRALVYELWLFRFADDRVIERWRFRDREDLYRQLGVYPELYLFPLPKLPKEQSKELESK